MAKTETVKTPKLKNPFFEGVSKKRDKTSKSVVEQQSVIEISFITLDMFMETLTITYAIYNREDLMTDQALAGTYKADAVNGQMTFKQSEIDMTKPIVDECVELLKAYFA